MQKETCHPEQKEKRGGTAGRQVMVPQVWTTTEDLVMRMTTEWQG